MVIVCLLRCLSLCRYLKRREQRLSKHRKTAEEALRQQLELLKKEESLDREEEEVNKLVNEALARYEQRTKVKKDKRKELSQHHGAATAKVEPPVQIKMATAVDASSDAESVEGETQPAPVLTKSSISEEIRASGSITEEVSEELLSRTSASHHPLRSVSVHTATSLGHSDYTLDAFESFHSNTLSRDEHLPHTSTPAKSSFEKLPQAHEDFSISVTGTPYINSYCEHSVLKRLSVWFCWLYSVTW